MLGLSCWSAARRDASRPQAMTRWPSAAKDFARPAPIPELAPVMSTVIMSAPSASRRAPPSPAGEDARRSSPRRRSSRADGEPAPRRCPPPSSPAGPGFLRRQCADATSAWSSHGEPLAVAKRRVDGEPALLHVGQQMGKVALNGEQPLMLTKGSLSVASGWYSVASAAGGCASSPA